MGAELIRPVFRYETGSGHPDRQLPRPAHSDTGAWSAERISAADRLIVHPAGNDPDLGALHAGDQRRNVLSGLETGGRISCHRIRLGLRSSPAFQPVQLRSQHAFSDKKDLDVDWMRA